MNHDDVIEKCTELEEFLINRCTHAAPAPTFETRTGTCRKCKGEIQYDRWLYQLPTCLQCQKDIENEESSNGCNGRLSISYRKVEFLAFSHAELYGEDEPEEITGI